MTQAELVRITEKLAAEARSKAIRKRIAVSVEQRRAERAQQARAFSIGPTAVARFVHQPAPICHPYRQQVMAITFGGKTQSAAQWAREIGISESTLRDRLQVLGWPVERALTEATNTTGRKPRSHQRRQPIHQPHHHNGGYAETSHDPLGTGGGSTARDLPGQNPSENGR